MGVQVVTAFFPLGRTDRTESHYMKWLEALLAMLPDVTTHVLLDEKSAFGAFGGTVRPRHHIRFVPLESLPLHGSLPRVKEVLQSKASWSAVPDALEFTNPLYTVVVNSKFQLVVRAAEAAVADGSASADDIFVWMDAGLSRFMDPNFVLEDLNSVFRGWLGDRVAVLDMDGHHEEWHRRGFGTAGGACGAGLMAGPLSAWKALAAKARGVWEEMLAGGRADNEQKVLDCLVVRKEASLALLPRSNSVYDEGRVQAGIQLVFGLRPHTPRRPGSDHIILLFVWPAAMTRGEYPPIVYLVAAIRRALEAGGFSVTLAARPAGLQYAGRPEDRLLGSTGTPMGPVSLVKEWSDLAPIVGDRRVFLVRLRATPVDYTYAALRGLLAACAASTPPIKPKQVTCLAQPALPLLWTPHVSMVNPCGYKPPTLDARNCGYDVVYLTNGDWQVSLHGLADHLRKHDLWDPSTRTLPTSFLRVLHHIRTDGTLDDDVREGSSVVDNNVTITRYRSAMPLGRLMAALIRLGVPTVFLVAEDVAFSTLADLLYHGWPVVHSNTALHHLGYYEPPFTPTQSAYSSTLPWTIRRAVEDHVWTFDKQRARAQAWLDNHALATRPENISSDILPPKYDSVHNFSE